MEKANNLPFSFSFLYIWRLLNSFSSPLPRSSDLFQSVVACYTFTSLSILPLCLIQSSIFFSSYTVLKIKCLRPCCKCLANYCSYVYFFLFQSRLWSAAAPLNSVASLFRFVQFIKYVYECSSCFCLNWIISFAFRPLLQFQALLILILSCNGLAVLWYLWVLWGYTAFKGRILAACLKIR